MKPLVAVVVLNWRQAEMTAACLRSVQALTYPHVLTIVVDNHSQDGSIEKLRSWFPEVVILETKRNLGFAGGVNVGIRYALAHGADWVLLLNNDAMVAPDLLEKLLSVAAKDPRIGVVAPQIFYSDEPSHRWSIGSRRSPLTLAPRDFGPGRAERANWTKPRPVDYVLGCAMLVRSRVFQEVGLFDEGYFFYYEDLDFSLRVQQAGYQLWVCPDAHVWHNVSASTAEDTPLRHYYLARSSVRFFRRYARNKAHTLFLLVYRGLVAVKKLAIWAWQKRWREALAYLRGLADGWRDGS